MKRNLILALSLVLSLSGIAGADKQARANGSERPLIVMTRNMYFGTDLAEVIGATTFEEFAVEVAEAYTEVQQSDIPARAAAIAGEIESTHPDLVGLQEAAVWRTGPFGGPATTLNLRRAADASR
jgi:hypothetical protein